ncbi:Uncharacterized protein QTN25_010012 [Entamoeba marina]
MFWKIQNSPQAGPFKKFNDVNGCKLSVVVQENEYSSNGDDTSNSDTDDDFDTTFDDNSSETDSLGMYGGESDTEFVRELDINEVVCCIKNQTLKKIVKSHNDSQGLLCDKFRENYEEFINEYQSFVEDMKLFGLGLVDEEQVRNILNCLHNIIGEMSAVYDLPPYIEYD